MASTFAWLDGDDAHRQKMLEVVKLFQDEGSVDELGIGSVRDAFSNGLFPGTSVLHTRARYLLFVPWLLRDVSRHGWPLERARRQLRAEEVRLIRALLAGGEHRGVIGNQAQERLKTMPSAVYWSALGTYGIRKWDTTIDGHLRHAALNARRLTETADDEYAGPSDLGIHRSIPPAPDDLLDTATFSLSADEADYLRTRLATAPAGSLLSWLARHGSSADADYIWEHPQLSEFDGATRTMVDHARRFHHVVYGAVLLYNLMLARKTANEELLGDYRDALAAWDGELDNVRAIDGWDRKDFWQVVRRLNPRVSARTELFLNRWFELVSSGGYNGVRAQKLIEQRELSLKGNRSRLLNPDALARWTGGSGLMPLDYRWGVASSHLRDIYAGLAA